MKQGARLVLGVVGNLDPGLHFVPAKLYHVLRESWKSSLRHRGPPRVILPLSSRGSSAVWGGQWSWQPVLRAPIDDGPLDVADRPLAMASTSRSLRRSFVRLNASAVTIAVRPGLTLFLAGFACCAASTSHM